MLGLFALGLWRLVDGLRNGQPIRYLVVLVLAVGVGVGLWYLRRLRRLTPKPGLDALGRLHRMHSYLHPARFPDRTANGPSAARDRGPACSGRRDLVGRPELAGRVGHQHDRRGQPLGALTRLAGRSRPAGPALGTCVAAGPAGRWRLRRWAGGGCGGGGAGVWGMTPMTGDTWGISGPTFLAGYLIIGATLYLVALTTRHAPRRRRRRGPRPAQPGVHDRPSAGRPAARRVTRTWSPTWAAAPSSRCSPGRARCAPAGASAPTRPPSRQPTRSGRSSWPSWRPPTALCRTPG